MLGNLAKDPHRNSGVSVNCVHFSVKSSLRRKIYHHAGNLTAKYDVFYLWGQE